MLNNLKSQQFTMASLKGKDDFDEMEKLKEQSKQEASARFEKRMSNKILTSSNREIIDAYETILYKKRFGEKEILNKVRNKEYEKNRPPADKWFELKTPDFSKELYRNRVSNKPNNENSLYLKKL